MKGQICKFVDELKPAIAMVVVHISLTGVNILYKLAANQKLNLIIIIAYRWIFASAFLLPLAFFTERKKMLKLTWMVVFQGFLCGFFGGVVTQNTYVESIALTSATYVSAMANLLPALTLILAVSFRMEKLKMNTKIGKAKLMGTIAEIGGAMILTFYKGVEINFWSINSPLSNHKQQQNNNSGSGSGSGSYFVGSLLALCSILSYAVWLIIQTKMSKRHPYPYTCAALMSIMASTQCVVFGLCMERSWSQWRLRWNLMLLIAVYSGIMISGVVVILIAWCVRVRDPVFVANFNPLSLLLTAITESILLNEKLHLGSILGAALIVCGLYMVLWGKGKELKENAQVMPKPRSPEFNAVEVVTEGGQTNSKDDPLPKEQYSQNESLSESKTQDKITN